MTEEDLEENFLIKNYARQFYEKILQLKQGTLTMIGYIEWLNELITRYELSDDDEHQLAR